MSQTFRALELLSTSNFSSGSSLKASDPLTLRVQDGHIFKTLDLVDEQGGGRLLVIGRHRVETIVDGRLERLEGVKPGGVLRGQPAQLVVDQGQELPRGVGLALLDG